MFTKWKCQYNYCPAASKPQVQNWSKVLLVETGLQGELMERGLKTPVREKREEKTGEIMKKLWTTLNKNIV